MRILVACEFSGVVSRSFRERGHESWSCDLKATEGDGWHIQEDVLSWLERGGWDLLIAFSECTHLCSSGARHFAQKRLDGRQQAGIDFFMQFANTSIPKWCIENPIGIMSSVYRKPDQIIQPWQFGHGETKATCLWLNDLPKLVSTDVVSGREARVHRMAPSDTRSADRSRTYLGIAMAMAAQWG